MQFYPVPSVSPEECGRNTALALDLGLPSIERAGHVAVVGGGLSLAGHLDELRAWTGPIWAINRTFVYLKERGIRSTFITADPKPQPWLTVEPGDRALVALHGSPGLFASLAKAHVTTYRLAEDEVHCGCTTATAAPMLAILLGHRSVTFFGCDSSFSDQSHVYPQAMARDLIEVRCSGEVFITKPEFLLQAEALALLCRELPEFHSNRGGGLTAALIENPDYEAADVRG